MEGTPLLPLPQGLQMTHIEKLSTGLMIHVLSTQPTCRCPLCGASTDAVHSRYQRSLKDLPCCGQQIGLQLTVRKFFCQITWFFSTRDRRSALSASANDLSMARARELSCISTTADGACREADAICAGPYLARAWPFLQRDWKAPGSRRANRAAMAWTRVCSLQPASTKAAKPSRSLRSLCSLSRASGRTISLAAVSRNPATRFFWLTQHGVPICQTLASRVGVASCPFSHRSRFGPTSHLASGSPSC